MVERARNSRILDLRACLFKCVVERARNSRILDGILVFYIFVAGRKFKNKC